MKIVKIKGYGPSLGMKLVEPLEITPDMKISLIGWYFTYDQPSVFNEISCGFFNCIEVHCNIVDTCLQNYNENFQAPEEELLCVCRPKDAGTRKYLCNKLEKTVYKGFYEPSELLKVNVKTGIKKIRNIAVELKTNLGTNEIFEKVNSSIYLVID